MIRMSGQCGISFHERIWAGQTDLSDNQRKIVYGRVHWEQLLQNMRQARLAQAIRIVEERNTRSGGPHLLLPSAP
jgi:hypothetical protein